jgi:ACS family hexuronate transporter-like MFS transporter
MASGTASDRAPSWKWWVCGLLMLATMLNYMDRLTLSQTAPAIKAELHLTHAQYGQIEEAFGIAFALGALVVGWMVDRWNVRWIYLTVVLAWSAAGFATGFAQDLSGLLLCRFLLGLAEAGNWPCALRTTQHLLPAAQRTLGNGILQSGAAIGAMVTPLIVLLLVDEAIPGSWRWPFFVIGALGIAWSLLWWTRVRTQDLVIVGPKTVPGGAGVSGRPAGLLQRGLAQVRGQVRVLAPLLSDRRFWILVVVAVAINTTWHYFRVWMPLFLREVHDYTLEQTNWFSLAYYLATDAGSLAAGFLTLALTRRGWTVHGSRLAVYLGGALLTLLSLVAANLPTGPWLLGVLLLIGFGALAVFPVYYALTQELTVLHQGKVNGMLGCLNWLAMSQLHPLVGRAIDQTESYSLGMGLVGLVPLLGFAVLWLFWRPRSEPAPKLPTG